MVIQHDNNVGKKRLIASFVVTFFTASNVVVKFSHGYLPAHL